MTLAAGELDPTLTHMGIETGAALGIGQLRDELVGTRPAYGFPQLFFSGVGPAIQQVFANRAVQQRGVLGDHADLRTQAGLGHQGNVLAIDQDASAFQVIQT
ncbi:hypothetical protein D9M71_683200 [compost metagenome]